MKKLILLTLLCQLSVFSQNNLEKYHRAKIIYQTIENLKKLEKLGVPMDHGTHKIGYSLTSDFSDSEILKARNLGLQVIIQIDDVQKYYVNQNKNNTQFSPENTSCNTTATSYNTPTNFNLGTMGGYLTYAQMLHELDDMRTLYPNLITAKENVGSLVTSENRALQWVKITKDVAVPNSRPQILYTAIHHAREPIALSETIFYMWYLLENYATNNEVKSIVDNTEMYFIPVVNPDGYVFNQSTNPNGGGMWRKNRRNFNNGTFGVDNNRNYDYWINGDSSQSVWNTLGVSPTTTGETYPGTSAFSEPENQAVNYFVENHNFKFALNAHTYSNLLLYPYGYDLNVPSPDDLLFSKISGLLVSQNNFTNQISSALYAASGDSDDFMYGQTMNHAKIFAFTPEIGSSFWPASTEIIPLCNKMMFTNLTTAKLVLNYAKTEDKSPNYIGISATFPAQFELTKYGIDGNGNYTVSINPISSNIISVGSPFIITNMATLDIANSSIQIELANGTTSGDSIIYEIVTDNGFYLDKTLVTKKFGQFQNILTNNCSSVTTNFTNSGWATTTEAFVSPNTSITDSPNANYQPNQTKTISLTAPINLTSLPDENITFETKWDLENNYDYVQFQVSTDNGLTWISQCGTFTNQGNTSTGEPNEPLYDGIQNTWVTETINISQYFGQTIKVRFLFKSDGGSEFDGFYFDDLKVNILQNNTLLNTTNNAISKFGIYPNPTNSILNINTTQNNYRYSVYSIQGQMIMKKDNNNGFQTIDLNSLSTGVYFIDFESNNLKETKKIVKK